jgi:GTP-binding protein HflX
VIVTDTVGFIHKLPHQLIDAFRATLDEVARADLILEVVDASDAHADDHRAVVQEVLDELGAGDKPRVVAFNKVDLVNEHAQDPDLPAPAVGGVVYVSALTGFGLDTLRARIAGALADLWQDVDVTVPYSAGQLLARIRERGNVELQYRDDAVRVRGRMDPALAGELRAASNGHGAGRGHAGTRRRAAAAAGHRE